MESRIRSAATDALRAGDRYWEALAADLDARLMPLLTDAAIAASGTSVELSRCESLRRFHHVSPAACLLMGPCLPGRILADASFGLRYGQDVPLGEPARPEDEAEPIWSLRVVMADGAWRVDPYTDAADWEEIGYIEIERLGPELVN